MLLGVLASAFLIAPSPNPVRQARTLTYRYEFSGSPVGTSTVRVREDGTFEGETSLDLGQKIEATFSGTAGPTSGLSRPISGWKFAMKSGGQEIVATRDASGMVLEAQKQRLPVKDGTLPNVYATFAPYFLRTLSGAFRAEKPPTSIDVFSLDRFNRLTLPITSVVRRRELTIGTFKIGAVEISAAFDADGECIGFDVPAQKLRVVAEGFATAFASPLDAYPELSPATFATERGTEMVPMRDGKRLASEIIRPKTAGKVPTILVRTPYGRASEALTKGWFAARGYAVVVQDCRGRGDSEGAWTPFVNEGRDGKDVIDWIARQPWSDGKVGMVGASYGGFVQWAAAVEKPVALRCLIPEVSPPASAMRNLPYVYGVPMLLSNLWWLRIVESKNADLSFYSRGFPGASKLTTLPLTKLDNAVFGRNLAHWDDWMRRDRIEKWSGWNFQAKLAGVTIPALHVTGYFDGDEIGTMLNYETRREAGWTNQWLVMGPWPHGFNASTSFGGEEFGKGSVLDLDSKYLRFFDTHLKGRTVAWSREPKVSAFLTGANRWVHADSWPIAEGEERSLYLAGEGRISGKGAGELLLSPRKGDRPSRYTYDPAKVRVPKGLSEPQLDMEGSLRFDRKDVTAATPVFRSAVLKTPLRMMGPIRLEATVSTSARSTDLFAMVLDQEPNGRIRRVGQFGVLRVGTKNDGDTPGAVVPNRPYAVSIRIWDFAHEFRPGHRMMLLLSSDGFPAFARNLGTAEPVATGTRMVVQRNVIHHDAVRISRLRFRALP